RRIAQVELNDTVETVSRTIEGAEQPGALQGRVAGKPMMRARFAPATGSSAHCSGAVTQLLRLREQRATPPRTCRGFGVGRSRYRAGEGVSLAPPSRPPQRIRFPPDPVAVARVGASRTWALRDDGYKPSVFGPNRF